MASAGKPNAVNSYHVVDSDNEVIATLQSDAVGICVRLRETAERLEKVNTALHGAPPASPAGPATKDKPEPTPCMRFYLDEAMMQLRRITDELDAIERRL